MKLYRAYNLSGRPVDEFLEASQMAAKASGCDILLIAEEHAEPVYEENEPQTPTEERPGFYRDIVGDVNLLIPEEIQREALVAFDILMRDTLRGEVFQIGACHGVYAAITAQYNRVNVLRDWSSENRMLEENTAGLPVKDLEVDIIDAIQRHAPMQADTMLVIACPTEASFFEQLIRHMKPEVNTTFIARETDVIWEYFDLHEKLVIESKMKPMGGFISARVRPITQEADAQQEEPSVTG